MLGSNFNDLQKFINDLCRLLLFFTQALLRRFNLNTPPPKDFGHVAIPTPRRAEARARQHQQIGSLLFAVSSRSSFGRLRHRQRLAIMPRTKLEQEWNCFPGPLLRGRISRC